jgi:hypothetical protein
MAEEGEHKELELADSQMIAEQMARVTLNMIHALYGADRARFRRMSHLILVAIPPALSAEIKNDEAFARIGLWRVRRKLRKRARG